MTTPPFGFSNAPVAPVAAATPAAAPVAAAVPAGPPVGSLVTWTEDDIYSETHPVCTRYGLVVSYDANGAAQVLTIGQARHAAHFAPVPADGSEPQGATVAALTVLR